MNTFKTTLALFFAFALVQIAHAQYCTDSNRFSNAECFSENQIDSIIDSNYGSAFNADGVLETLYLDYYFPAIDTDTLESRPLVLLIHGGGFQGGDKSGLADECLEFAKRGFVAATINYRLGYDDAIIGDELKALYRAHQDANAALRYSIENAEVLGIDSSWVFIGGGSAGSITSIFTSYVDSEEYDNFYPGIESILGSLDDSGNDLTHSFTIKGIFNNWGSGSPGATQLEEMIPMISFHGALDMIVPIETASNGLVGSLTLHNMSIEAGVCSQLNIDPEGGHVVYDLPSEMVFRVEKASCFFKSVFCEDCSSSSTEVYEPANCSAASTAIEGTDKLHDVTAFPNPFTEQLQFSGLCGNELFTLYDSHGHVVIKGKAIPNFMPLATGFYVLHIEGDVRPQSIKLSKL